MATAQPGVWGIDLGQCALKALRLQQINGEVVATAFDYIEHPKILSQPDADPDQLTRAALEQFLSRNQIRGDQIAISVPGQTGLARFVKLPPVEAKKIPDIVRFEAKQQIPFPLEEVVWDWQTIGVGGQTGGFVENEIGLFAMKRDMVNRYLQAFRDVNVEVHYVQMAPLALCNFVTYDVLEKAVEADAAKKPAEGEEEEETTGGQPCVVSLDIGADSTNLVVTDGGKIIWQRPIPIGGNHFTRALTKDLKLTFAKAEHLKRNATKAEDPKKIFQSMKPVFTDFVGELQRSLGFFTNTHRNARVVKILGLGNAFRLPGLQKFISQSLGQELDKLQSFHRLKGDEVVKSPVYSENVLSFGVAYGLALQGLGLSKLTTNLLPHEIQMERTIRAKKPWAIAAAAALLVGVTVFAGGAASQKKHADAAAKAAAEGDKTVADKATLDANAAAAEAEMKKKWEATKVLPRGSEERVNWARLHRYINECLPQPDGSGFPDTYLTDKDGRVLRDTKTGKALVNPQAPLRKYRTADAIKANQTRLDRLRKGGIDEPNPDHLLQINVTGVFVRYCDGTMPTLFFNGLKNTNYNPSYTDRDYLVVDPDDPDKKRKVQAWKKPPKGPGWAVEIRGYTNHKERIDFVYDTLVKNLRTRKIVLSPVNDPAPAQVRMDVSHVAVRHYTDNTGKKVTRDTVYGLIDRDLFLNQDLAGTTGTGGTRVGFNPATAPAPPPGGEEGGTAPVRRGPALRPPWIGLGEGFARRAAPGNGEFLPGVPEPGGEHLPTQTTRIPDRYRTEFIIYMFWVEPLPTEPKQVFEESTEYSVDPTDPYQNQYGPEGYGQPGNETPDIPAPGAPGPAGVPQ